MWHRSHMIHCCSESPEPCPQKIPLRSWRPGTADNFTFKHLQENRQVSCLYVMLARCALADFVIFFYYRMHLMVRGFSATDELKKKLFPARIESNQLTWKPVHFGQGRKAGVHPQEGPEWRGYQVCAPGSLLPWWQVLEVRFFFALLGSTIMEGKKDEKLIAILIIDTVLPWRSDTASSWRSSLVWYPCARFDSWRKTNIWLQTRKLLSCKSIKLEGWFSKGWI